MLFLQRTKNRRGLDEVPTDTCMVRSAPRVPKGGHWGRGGEREREGGEKRREGRKKRHREMLACKPRGEVSGETKPVTATSWSSSFSTVRSKFLWFNPPGLWYTRLSVSVGSKFMDSTKHGWKTF